jgi:hypothetical protein
MGRIWFEARTTLVDRSHRGRRRSLVPTVLLGCGVDAHSAVSSALKARVDVAKSLGGVSAL